MLVVVVAVVVVVVFLLFCCWCWLSSLFLLFCCVFAACVGRYLVGICICFCNKLLFWDCCSHPPPPSHDPNSKRNPSKTRRRIKLMKSTLAQIFLRSFCKCSPNVCKSARAGKDRASGRPGKTRKKKTKKKRKKPGCVSDPMPPSAPGGWGHPASSRVR